MASTSQATTNYCSNQTNTLLKRFENKIDKFFTGVVSVAIIAELILMFGNLLVRFLFNFSYHGSEELGELTLMIIAFIGGAIAYPRGQHVAVEILYRFLPSRCHEFIRVTALWMVVLISLIAALLSIQTVFVTMLNNLTPVLKISKAWYTLPMIVGLFLLVYYGLIRLLEKPRRIVLVTGVILLAVFALALLTQPIWMEFIDDSSVLIVVSAALVFLLLIGMPIGFVLAAGSMLYIYLSDSVDMTAVPIAIQTGMMNFVLLSIPFFVMAGYVMTEGGLSQRLIHFIMSLVGRVRGGLFHVMVVVAYVVAGLSGSKAADVTAVGATMNETLRKEGYDPGETASVLAASAIMGETVPPCINMIVLGSISTLSIGTLFVAGLLPAIVMGIIIMILIGIRAQRAHMPISIPVPFEEIKKRALIALPALIAPVLMIGGIVGGVGTPTEISSATVVYSLLIGIILYREINLKSIWNIVIDSASMAGMVLFIMSTASAFSWSLTLAQVPHQIAESMIAISGNSSTIFMMLTIFLLIVMGAVLEGLPAILIFGPLLLPIAPQFGIDPLQLGIVIIMSMGLGNFLPPVGLCAYICVTVSKTTLEDMMQHMPPYAIAVFIGIVVIALFPWVTLVVPRALHLIN